MVPLPERSIPVLNSVTMEKEALLRNDDVIAPALHDNGRKGCYSKRSVFLLLVASTFLLLSSLCLNCILVGLLVRQHDDPYEITQYGRYISLNH